MPLPPPPPDAASAVRPDSDFARWAKACVNGPETVRALEGAYGQGRVDAEKATAARFDALLSRLARAESALVEARVRAAMADQYLRKAKAAHTRATSGPMYEVRDRAPGALDEMERLTWCAHDCLDETSDTIKGSKVWIEEEAKARALLATPGEGEGA